MSRVESFNLDMYGFDQSPRTIWVYLPDSYDSHPEHQYDVLYMFDGHNLFFDDVATYGKSWGIKTYLDNHHLDLVVVGQDCNHSGNQRISEYCPFQPIDIPRWHVDYFAGDRTAEWFVNVLKPEIERRYHVSHDREHLGIGGSSMGGLMSDYMAAKYSHIYSKFACISPATQFCADEMYHLIQKSDINPNTKLYRSLGSEESSDYNQKLHGIDSLLHVSNLFIDHGCKVHTKVGIGLNHSEAAWETLVPEFIQFLYPSSPENN